MVQLVLLPCLCLGNIVILQVTSGPCAKRSNIYVGMYVRVPVILQMEIQVLLEVSTEDLVTVQKDTLF